MNSHHSKAWNITGILESIFKMLSWHFFPLQDKGEHWTLALRSITPETARILQASKGPLKQVYPKTLYRQAEGIAWQPHCTLLMLLTPEPFTPQQIVEFNADSGSFSDCCRRFSTMQGNSLLCSHCMNNIKGRNWTSLTQQSVNWRPD